MNIGFDYRIHQPKLKLTFSKKKFLSDFHTKKDVLNLIPIRLNGLKIKFDILSSKKERHP